MGSTGTLDDGQAAASPIDVSESDPEVARVRAVLESRLLGLEQPPVRIGRFVVIERVGAGGMGVVFAAFDPQLDRKVAIKLLSNGAQGEGERIRLVREAKALAKLAHPNVVGVYEVGEHHGRVFVAMEYVQGRTLKAWLSEPGRGWREKLATCVQAGRGLAAAHAAGIVHRDFKPENVLVGDDGRARVADFGLARGTVEAEDPRPLEAADTLTGQTSSKLTRTGALVGTPAYMSPEQIRGERVDASADQFAFCITAWEALVGERPFAGDTIQRLFEDVTAGGPRRSPRGAMPGWLERTLRQGLASDAGKRHLSMDSLLAMLERGAGRRRRAWLTAGVTFVALASVGGWLSAGAPTPIWFIGEDAESARRFQESLDRTHAIEDAEPLAQRLEEKERRFGSRDERLAKLVAAIECGDGKCLFTQAALDAVANDFQFLFEGYETVPVIEDAQIRGVQLYAVASGGLLERLGLQNDDVIRSVGGHPVVGGPFLSNEIHRELMDAGSFIIELERGGEARSLEITWQGDLGPLGVVSSESKGGITVAPGGQGPGGGMITVAPHVPEASGASAFMMAYALAPEHRPQLGLVELMQLANQRSAEGAPKTRAFALGGSNLMDTVVLDHVPPGDYTLCVWASRARWRSIENVLGYECQLLTVEADGDTRRLDAHPLGR